MSFAVRSEVDPELVVATGQYILVAVRKGAFKPVPVPEVVRERLRQYVET